MGLKQLTMGFKQNTMGFKQNRMVFLTQYDGVYTVLYIIDHFDLDFFMLFISVCRPLGHKPTNAPPIMTFVKLFFVFGENTLLGTVVRGFSWRS